MYMNDLIQEIKKTKEEGLNSVSEKSEILTYLIFSVNDKKFAIKFDSVKEILKDSEIFPIPFVPPYLVGILNYHGNPCAVVDFSIFIGEKSVDSSIYLVLNDESETCIKVSDVKEFYQVKSENVINSFNKDENEYFDGILKFNNQEIFIIDFKSFIKKLGKKLAE